MPSKDPVVIALESSVTQNANSPSLMAVYYNSLGSCRYTFKNGKDAVFLSGRYATNNISEIEELEAELTQGHPHIYIDPNKRTVSSVQPSAMEDLRQKIIAEYMAEQAGKSPINVDLPISIQQIPEVQSVSVQGPVIVANTSSASQAVVDSSSGGIVANTVSSKIVAGKL